VGVAMSHVVESLKELGFPVEVYSTEDLLYLEKQIVSFCDQINEIYKIYPHDSVSEMFSITSICEPWFAGFLARALDIKHQKQKDLS